DLRQWHCFAGSAGPAASRAGEAMPLAKVTSRQNAAKVSADAEAKKSRRLELIVFSRETISQLDGENVGLACWTAAMPKRLFFDVHQRLGGTDAPLESDCRAHVLILARRVAV